MTRPHRVLVVYRHNLFAEAISASLGVLGLLVLPVAGTAIQAIQLFRMGQPDLVLVDLDLADDEGCAVAALMLNEAPKVKVVALASDIRPDAVLAAAKAGFHGYLTKDITMSTLVRALVAIFAGQMIYPDGLGPQANGSDAHLNSTVGRAPDQEAMARIGRLTSREREVLRSLVEGKSGGEIARGMFVSPHTVRSHIQSILAKLQVHSRLEAAAFAIRHGLARSSTDA
jgi:two-component system, NarL family, nitrate/nitrite response regulator NarL